MPVETRFDHGSPFHFPTVPSEMTSSQNYNKSFYYAPTKSHLHPQGGPMIMGGMSNRGPPNYPFPGAPPETFRYPNVQMAVQKPTLPPLKMLVPSDMVGAIIGRGGATIREITKASRARVDVHRNDSDDRNLSNTQQNNANTILPGITPHAATAEKVISIYGKEGDSITTACKKILEVIDEELKKLRQNRLECGIRYINGFVAPLPVMETSLKMLAPNAQVGRIIGKMGKKVNEIKEKTGAKITVSNVYDINAENPERTIIISGSLEAISSAERRISEILRACHLQEAATFSAPENQNGRYPDDGYPPYSNYNGSMGRSGGGGGVPANLVGQPAMIGAGVVEAGHSPTFGGPPMLPHHHTQVPPPQYGNGAQYNGADLGNHHPHSLDSNAPTHLDTVFLYVPSQSVGAIIGKKGESVRQITRSTSAIIKIAAEKDKVEAKEEVSSPVATGAPTDFPAPPRDASMTPGEKSVAITAPFDAQCRAISLIFKKLFEERFFGNDPPFLALDLLIPVAQMGKVLGKQKIKIRTIERRTGVIIRVPENGASSSGETPSPVPKESGGGGVNTYLTIRGTLTQMLQAMSMVKEILHGEPMPGFRPPVPLFPPFPRNPYPYHDFGPREGRGRGRY